jgi:dTDP-glucose 4,6-dehydratase
MRLLVTGGAGFIGSNFVRARLAVGDAVTVLDKLTYAGHRENLADVAAEIRFVEGDICDPAVVAPLLTGDTDAVVNFAAETHVDRSILSAAEFVRTNVVGVQVLLDAVMGAGAGLFCQVSTDEVYGSAPAGIAFAEDARLTPSSPYSASKASADLIALGYHRTHGVPVVVTRCTNNYGPYQYPEKLIPLFILKAMSDAELPLYGDGMNERDWIHVEDHCAAVGAVIERGRPGEVYNIGAGHQVGNWQIVRTLLSNLGKGEELVRLVKDRPGHDRRYAVDTTKIATELGWKPRIDLADGLARTIDWYVAHAAWLRAVTGPAFDTYCAALYAGRPRATATGNATSSS